MAATRTKIQQLVSDLESYYADAYASARWTQRMVDQKYEGLIDVPYEVRIFKDSTAANIVAGFRNQIRTNEPTVDFHPFALSKAALKHANLMQRWGYSMLRRERELTSIDPNGQLAYDLLFRGAACKKILVDVDLVQGVPPKRGTMARREWELRSERGWPFVSRAIDPLSVFPPPGQAKPLPYIIERQSRYAEQVRLQYPTWADPKGKNGGNANNPLRKVEWLEYWKPGEYVIEADGETVFEKENPYELVPYMFDWSGMGRDDVDGNPLHLMVDILTEVLGEIEEVVRLKTAISVQTQMHVFPPILTVDDPRKVAKQFGVGPGKVIKHLPGHPPVYMSYPPPNENMYRFLEAIQQNIMRVSGSAIQGGRDGGVQFGVLQAQLVGQALTNISAVRATLDRMGGQTLNMMAHMMEKLDIHMAVEGSLEPAEEGATVKGTDFTHRNFEVMFEAVDPAENDRMLLVGEALRRAGDISRLTFHKKYAKHIVEDPDWESILIYAERIMDQLVESGMLQDVVLSQDVLEQMAEQAVDTAAQASAGINSSIDDVSDGTRLDVQTLENASGRPGSLSMPPEIAQQGMAEGRPSITGVPDR